MRSLHQEEVLFYDGHCGLCHRAVRFVLNHDHSGAKFCFAPLQGDTFRTRVPSDRSAGLPDSIVLQTRDGSLLVRSDACVHALRQLGGKWKLIGGMVGAIPRPVRDVVYNSLAAVRYRIFGRREDLCPVVPPSLRGRFYP